MNVKLKVLASSLLFVSTVAFGGNSGGGGEQFTSESNPWRVGPTPIEYCIERAANFPQSQQALSTLVAEVFQNWEDFFANYKMKGTFQSNAYNFQNLSLPHSAREVSTCTDTKTQIRFVFGIENSEMLDYKSNYAERVIGFAHRTNYDKATFQGSGVVWITPDNSYEEHTGTIVTKFPDWTWLPSLKHQLLHEVGHVFGMPHNSTWVMNEDVMHTQLWATLRRQIDKNGNGSMVPLGSIEIWSQVFDPLSGINTLNSCASFQTAPSCWLAPSVPKVVQKALNLNMPAHFDNPLVKIKFTQIVTPNPQPANEPPAPSYKMTISIPSKYIEKTVDLRPETLKNDLIPRLYISGAYAPEEGWLRRVYTGSFTTVLSGNGISIPMIVTAEQRQVKLSVFDPSNGQWKTWLTISGPGEYDPSPAN